MQENLDGLFEQAGDACRRGDETYGGVYAFSLAELGDNLRELRRRTFAGDLTALDEFFAIYVFSAHDDEPIEPRRRTIDEPFPLELKPRRKGRARR